MGNKNVTRNKNNNKTDRDFSSIYKYEWKCTLKVKDEVDYYDSYNQQRDYDSYNEENWKLFTIKQIDNNTEFGALTLEREITEIKNNIKKTETKTVKIDNWIKTTLIEPKGSYSTKTKSLYDINSLHYNCKHGNDEIVAKLVSEQKSIDINEHSKVYNGTPLIIALKAKHPNIALILLDNESINVNFQTPFTKQSALYVCCEKKYINVILKLMTFKHLQIDTQSLIYCARTGLYEILKHLLQSDNLNINDTLSAGKTALFYACAYNQIECVNLLLSDNRIDANGCNPFVVATKNNHSEIIKRLLQYHEEIKAINLNEKEKSYIGKTALMYLCERGNIELITKLLENNVDVTIRDKTGYSALCYAIKKGHYDVIELLLSHPMIEILGKELCDAVQYDQLKIFKLFLNPTGIKLKYSYIGEVGEGTRHLKANPNLMGNGETALYIASRKGCIKFIKTLIESCPDIDIEKGVNNKYISTPLMAAASGGHAMCTYYLIKNGAKIDNDTFCMAVQSGDASCVRFIYEHDPSKIDINYRYKTGRTPLMIAAKKGYGYSNYKNKSLNKKDINILINGYIKEINKNENYHIPNLIIFIIIEYFQIDGIIDLLIKYGANVLLTDQFNQTILSMAIEGTFSVDIIKLIYDEIANKTKQDMVTYINKIDDNDRTPLIYACCNKKPAIGRLLISKYGANIWQKCLNKYPYKYAKDRDDYDLSEYIMNLMYHDKIHSNKRIKNEIEKTREDIVRLREYQKNNVTKCFDGKGKVLMRNGSYKLIENLCINDEVKVFPNRYTKIKCIQISKLNKPIKMVYINNNNNDNDGGFWITFEHPILLKKNKKNILLTADNNNKYDQLNDLGLGTNEIKKYGLKWFQPKQLNKIKWKYQENVYNFILNEYHTINVNGFWCITLGHDFKGKGIEHEFYGNSKQIDKWLRTSPTYPVCVF